MSILRIKSKLKKSKKNGISLEICYVVLKKKVPKMEAIVKVISSKSGFIKGFLILISAIVFFNFFVSKISASQKYWTGSVSNEWTAADNWSPVGVPDSNSHVTISYLEGNEYPAIFEDNIVIKNLTINSGAVFTIQSFTLTVTNLFKIKKYGVVNQYNGEVFVKHLLIHKYGEYNVYGGILNINDKLTESGLLNAAGGNITLGGQPLPVELTSFTYSINKNSVALKWETATEINNYGFNVEKSADKLKWVKVGFVEGSGNSNSPKIYSFTDKNISSKKVYYRLVQIDNDGTTETTDAIEVDYRGNLAGYELAQNYPNPFNPTTVIKYSIPETANVEIKVYDMLGGEVANLVNDVKEAGSHVVNFNAANLTSGIYIYSIRAGEFVQTMKMTLLR